MYKSELDNGAKSVELDDVSAEDLVGCSYSLPITDYVKCPNCKHIVPNNTSDEYKVTDKWTYNDGFDTDDEYGEYTGRKEFTCPNCNKHYVWTDDNPLQTIWTDDVQDIPNIDEIVPGFTDVYNAVYKIYEQNNEDDWGKAFDIYMTNKKKGADKKVELKKENKQDTKLNLQEATIKALYDGLKDDTEINDVEGLVDDVLVVTDPEITTDEYNELIDRAKEIVEDTPEGDIPQDPTYLGEYLQICPICGGSFVADHIFEPGTACPICYETPEAFVLEGKLQSDEDVAEDNGLVDDTADNKEEINSVPNATPVSDNSDEDVETLDTKTDIEPENNEEPTTNEPVENGEEETPARVRGARHRRNRETASKEIIGNNKLTEKLEERVDPEEGFEINEELANTIYGLKVGSIVASYMPDTNTVVFYDTDKEDDIDTIVYRNETPDEILGYMKGLVKTDEKKVQEDYERYKVSFYVDSTETPRDEIVDKLNKVLTNSGLASSKDDIEIVVDEVIEEAKNEPTEKKYIVVNASEDDIRQLCDNSAFTWEGFIADDEHFNKITDDLVEKTNINLPVTFYIWKGKLFNEMYGLTGDNAYQDDLTFAAISLDNWSTLGNLPIYKIDVGARWLDDIVDNNAERQNTIDNEL